MAVDPILDEIILFLFISDISLMQNAKAIKFISAEIIKLNYLFPDILFANL